MATSDSEDFESADEEFEALKDKVIAKKEISILKKEVCENESISKTTVEDKSDSIRLSIKTDALHSTHVIRECSDGETVTKNNKAITELNHENTNIPSEGHTKNEITRPTKQRMTNLERQTQNCQIKQKSGSKKLGTQLPNVIQGSVANTKSYEEHLETNNDKIVSTISDKNIVVKTSDLKTQTSKSNVKVESPQESSSKCTNSGKNSSLKTDVNNDSDITLQSTRAFELQLPQDNKVISKSASGDGWEIEEEDGFEVPISLSTKPKNEIVQNEQEISPVLERLSNTVLEADNKTQGWSSWSGWGVTSLLSTASESMSTFSSHVTSGISTVLESSLGAPDPEELARHVAQEERKIEDNNSKSEEPISKEVEDTDKNESGGFSGLGSLMSGVSLLGTKVLSGGLDTLETLGKKTMEVLQEGDPMLRKKRAMFFHDPDKPVLSQVLKEAKEKAEKDDKEQAEKEASRKAHFETLFDDYQGLVHLEALEMLSRQCQLKLQSILLSYSGNALIDLQETLSEVKELCELPEDEDDEEVLTKEEFEKRITDCMHNLHSNLLPSKIIQVYDAVDSQLKDLGSEKIPAIDIHQKAISSLAEFTACAMECFHKGAELVLTKSHRSTADEAENFVILTTIFCGQVSLLAREFTRLLTKWDPIANSAYITNTFLEAGNSASYIQNAFQLLLPVIQVGAAS